MSNVHQTSWKRRQIVKHRYNSLSPKKGMPFGKLKRRSFLINRLIKAIVLLFLLAGVIGGVIFSALFYHYSKDLPSLEQIKNGSIIISESTKIYDRSGTHLLYVIHGEENRTRVPFSEISDYLKWATIATEDSDFYTRELAVDLRGFIRALLGIIKSRSLTQGPGGSTITQQLIKNLILTREKTLSRKFKEIILSFRIEKAFSRDEILALYLNQIPYGSNAYGAEEATQTFFDKHVKDITLQEAAILAALPKATTYYSPFGAHQDQLIQKRDIILKQMLDEGYINEDQYNQAKSETPKFKQKIEGIEAPHFVMYVKEILAKKYGEEALERGGLKVITTLDYELEKLAEKVVKEGADANDSKGADNAALTAIDPHNGQLLVMVGSRDYFDEKHQGNFNAAISPIPRQPGSSFKPIIYATLFNKGYTPNTILFDVQIDFAPKEGQEYIPENYDGKEHGPVTIRSALAGSLNIPAVEALYLAGIESMLETAAKLGYSTLSQTKSAGLSLALGSAGVQLLEHTAAFAVLANDGIRQPITTILKVEKTDGTVLEEWKETPGTRVLPANVSRMVTDILIDNEARKFIFGNNPYFHLGTRPAAVKTGTTNDFRDAWTMGYTPQLAAGVWVGRNDHAPMNKGTDGSKIAAPIWQKFMLGALKGKEVKAFPRPEIPKTGKPILDGDFIGVNRVKIDKFTKKLATQFTPEDYITEVSFGGFHNILYYIDRNNPLGPPPNNPEQDPQYKNWEQAVFNWWKDSKKITQLSIPPLDYDDVHLPENIPQIKILSPADGAVVIEDSINVDVDVKAPRGITKVEYYFDDDFRESAGGPPFSRTIYFGSLKKVQNGAHVITVKASDDAGNRNKAVVNIELKRETADNQEVPKIITAPSVSIVYPIGGAVISTSTFPVFVQLNIKSPNMIRRVDLYYNDKENNPIILDSQKDSLTENLNLDWVDAPPAGTYSLFVIWIDKNGRSYRNEVKVTIL